MQKTRCSHEIKQISLFFPAEKTRVFRKELGKNSKNPNLLPKKDSLSERKRFLSTRINYQFNDYEYSSRINQACSSFTYFKNGVSKILHFLLSSS